MPVAGPLAAVLKTIAKAIEDGHVKPPRPKPPQGRFISVEALEQLVERWRKSAADAEWGLGHAFDTCADDLEVFLKRTQDGQDDGKADEDDQR